MPENTWINSLDYVRVLNMLRYSYNDNIVIVTNVIMLKFLSAQYLRPSVLLPFYFLSKLEHKNNERQFEGVWIEMESITVSRDNHS